MVRQNYPPTLMLTILLQSVGDMGWVRVSILRKKAFTCVLSLACQNLANPKSQSIDQGNVDVLGMCFINASLIQVIYLLYARNGIESLCIGMRYGFSIGGRSTHINVGFWCCSFNYDGHARALTSGTSDVYRLSRFIFVSCDNVSLTLLLLGEFAA